MVFLGGARQVGKTTLAQRFIGKTGLYLNWDIAAHRERILRREWPTRAGLIVFDELHKYRGWRNYLKGLYDEHRRYYQVLVTGSARLDWYRYSGDSLQGRYHYLRMHPLSVAELGGTSTALRDLLQYGGFPEPFFGQDTVEARRWSQEYRTRLLREEITTVEGVRDLGHLELLLLRLPDLVGSPLSINGLREDLQLNHKTVSRWLDIFERFYVFFRLAPFGTPKIKAVKKEQKHYHLDWSLVRDPGARFENLVACHLRKWVDWQVDTKGRAMELRYVREVTGREVDFVILEDQRPLQFIEVKRTESPINPLLITLKRKFPSSEALQIHGEGRTAYRSPDGVQVQPAIELLKTLV